MEELKKESDKAQSEMMAKYETEIMKLRTQSAQHIKLIEMLQARYCM